MKKRFFKIIVIVLVVVLIITGTWIGVYYHGRQKNNNYVAKDERIYLIGERHGEEKYYQIEEKKWEYFYKEKNYRHLFLELSYFTGEFLNMWMKASDDTILDEVYDDFEGAMCHVPSFKHLFINIKQNCPETIFHATDIGHQYQTTGARYVQYLLDNHLEDSKQYNLAIENIEQGSSYYDTLDDNFRETKMIENFVREYESIEQANIMGIYGSYHSDPRHHDVMAGKLKEKYGDIITYHFVSFCK